MMKREKERKKINQKISDNEQTVSKNKKVPSHPLLQMQSIYGNRAIERVFKKKNEYMQEENKKELALQSFDIIPIFRFPNSVQDGVRVYKTKEQYHYDHRLFIPKKQNENYSDDEKDEQQIDDTKTAHSNRSYSQNSSLANQQLQSHTQQAHQTNERAREHLSHQMGHAKQTSKVSNLVENDTSIENESFDDFIQNKIKRGRFSFLNAYPILVALIQNKKKEEEKKKKKVRKRSRISRLARRFLGKV